MRENYLAYTSHNKIWPSIIRHIGIMLLSRLFPSSTFHSTPEKGFLMFNNRKTEGAPISAVSTEVDRSTFVASQPERHSLR